MGVPKFFRYISERYPCLSELAREDKIPEFDNLYLDMNGIIHNCSHPDDGNVHFRISEDEMYRDIFNYIDKLFFLIKPKKLFFLAVDGVAPRAKMNQQRSRRFRSAKEAELQEKAAIQKGEVLPETARFDSNCITPGTEFMVRLQIALRKFISQKVSTNSNWRKCRVILSGHETPGEGEHKIMEYIRYFKCQSEYDPNTRHCLYGLDADLIILGLCTHELHFSLLREEVSFGKKAKRSTLEQTRFYLLHLILLREYLELEFQDLYIGNEKAITERLIDDWILMGFLVGNDFIPHLPNMHITSNALPILYDAYKKVWPQLGGYINEAGCLNLERLQKLIDVISEHERSFFEEVNADLKYFEAKTSHQEDVPEAFGTDAMEIELEELIKNTAKFVEEVNEEFDDADIAEEEFKAFKRNYYINKLQYNEATPEVLAEQTECYVTALQWILYYYYKGVPSWGWYYPHHYAPFASDLKNIKDLNIKFELGRPFLPFQQLLAVLPAASKNLLPEAFQDLMTDAESKLIEYYPSEFQTDLNGKRQEWEAVVLIPFIDEEALIGAMDERLSKLKQEEIDRNIHGPMLLYEFKPKNIPQSSVISPNSKCTEMEVWREDIVKKTKTNLSSFLAAKRVVHPGFPTMKYLTYEGVLKNGKVKVFESLSKNLNMILLPQQSKEMEDIEEISEKYLNKILYIGWPHLIEAKVIAISNKYRKCQRIGDFEENNSKIFDLQIKAIMEHNLRRMGIDFQEIKTLVHTLPLIGKDCTYTAKGGVVYKKAWGSTEITYPYQGIVENPGLQSASKSEEVKIEEIFSQGSTVFMLGNPYHSCEGKILDPTLVHSCGRLKVNITVLPDPDFYEARKTQRDLCTQYFNAHDASSQIGITANILARVTGCLFLIKGAQRSDINENTPKVNVGLHMRFPKNNEELVGYTRKAGHLWLYSYKTVNLVKAYYNRFPKLFEMIQNNASKDIYFESDLFPDQIGNNAFTDMMMWIKEQDYHKAERVPCGTKLVEKEALLAVISSIDKLKTLPVTSVKLQVKPHLILRPDTKVPEAFRPKKPLRLFDRVVIIKSTYQVPAGYRGTIIGVHPVLDSNPVRVECINSVEMFYEVYLDKNLSGGNDLYGLNVSSIFKVPEQCVLPTSESAYSDENNKREKREVHVDREDRYQYSKGANNGDVYRNFANVQQNHKLQLDCKANWRRGNEVLVNDSKPKRSINHSERTDDYGNKKNTESESGDLSKAFTELDMGHRKPVHGNFVIKARPHSLQQTISHTISNTSSKAGNSQQQSRSFVNATHSKNQFPKESYVQNPNSAHLKDHFEKFDHSRNEKKRPIEIAKNTSKEARDKTDKLKEMLGITGDAKEKHKIENINAALLPKPPSSWRNNVAPPEIHRPSYNSNPLVMPYLGPPNFREPQYFSGPSMFQPVHHPPQHPYPQQHPIPHSGMFQPNTFTNYNPGSNNSYNWSASAIGAPLIPLQAIKKLCVMKKPQKEHVNKGNVEDRRQNNTGHGQFSNERKMNGPTETATVSASKSDNRKRETYKRTPRIAAKFDNAAQFGNNNK